MVMNKNFIRDISQIVLNDRAYVACIGFFDGLHLGHQALINKTKARANDLGIESMLITFDPDPWSVLNKKSNVKHITPLKKKLQVIESLGIDKTVILNFDSDFSNLSPQEFVERVLIALGITELVVGSDFRFGHRGKGNVSYLQSAYGDVIKTHEIKLQSQDEKSISSTYIIQTILNGKVDLTSDMLGRDYEISGFVVDGQKIGRTLGFPTANLKIEDEYVIPKTGVYAGYVKVLDQTFKSIVNIGHNPTINTQEQLMIETHILDFNQEIYGEVIHQGFTKRLRDELKFDSLEALIEAMENDEKEARKIL